MVAHVPIYVLIKFLKVLHLDDKLDGAETWRKTRFLTKVTFKLLK